MKTCIYSDLKVSYFSNVIYRLTFKYIISSLYILWAMSFVKWGQINPQDLKRIKKATKIIGNKSKIAR